MGGIILGGIYTSRLRDVLRGALRRALLGGLGGMLPREKKFNWCNLVRFGVYLGQILSLKNFKNYYFLYKNLINYTFFFNKNFKSYYFLYKNKYIRYTLASCGVILLKKYLEAFHDR